MMGQPLRAAELTIQQLKNVIENHRKKGATTAPTYLEALRELEIRTGGGLDFDKSFAIIREAARAGRCISYKDLADASGASWSKVHYEVGGHLWRLVEYAHRMGWPMLSAIVVNKPNIATGKMDPATLKGFVTAARALGHAVTDEEGFLRKQQAAVFAWGQTADTA
jgi:hypothetical protein